MIKFDWACPYCGKDQVVTDANYDYKVWDVEVGKHSLGNTRLVTTAIACLSEACRRLSLDVSLNTRIVSPQGQIRTGESFHSWRLLPESSAKPQPDCIPAVLRNDYIEACRIKDLSSKASATLARRCLQGMIRDFAKISRATLDLEIKELRRRVEAGNAPQGVTSESVEGIDHVRTIGNIGAHMEKDVNLVVEIEPGEAQALIELFEEWYIEREARSARLAKVAAMSAQKKTARLQATSSPPSPVPEQEQILEREVVSEELSVVGSGPPVDSEATKVAQ